MNQEYKKIVQNQLRQFLRAYRHAENISAEDAACKLDLEITSYRKLEGLKPENRVISSISYLEKIAKLRAKSLVDFISFLTPQDLVNGLGRGLYLWEKNIISGFEKMSVSKRNKFLNYLSKLEEDELSDFYDHLVEMSKKRSSKISFTTRILRELKDD